MKIGHIQIIAIIVAFSLAVTVSQSKLLHQQTLNVTYSAALNETQKQINSSLVEAITKL